MPRGGYRPGAGRKRKAQPVGGEILPALPGMECPPDMTPLDFLKSLMRDTSLPLNFRRDCAMLALPYVHAKPIMGLKDMRLQAAYDDVVNDPIAAALRDG